MTKYEAVAIYSVKNGEEAATALSDKFKALIEDAATAVKPKWLDVDLDAVSAKVIALPQRDDIDFPFEEQLIVELYSK